MALPVAAHWQAASDSEAATGSAMDSEPEPEAAQAATVTGTASGIIGSARASGTVPVARLAASATSSEAAATASGSHGASASGTGKLPVSGDRRRTSNSESGAPSQAVTVVRRHRDW
jgi:hypothetical protein